LVEGPLSQEVWDQIQNTVPIACVDVLATRKASSGALEVGLIFRTTPHEGQRWCLIGGRLLRKDSFQSAVLRELSSALGPLVHCVVPSFAQPIFVAEYFPEKQPGRLFDPRRHAIGLTFAIEIDGTLRPEGEALDFQWFSPNGLPPEASFGFGQHIVVVECIRRLITNGPC
jgi:ADP-ribose pyrophosphatase YjhB (NUDIX family)